MTRQFSIELTSTAYGHLESLRPYDRRRILDGVKRQLRHRPTQETLNKKMLRANPVADWELRIHPFRVFYEVDETGGRVRVLAVGIKQRNKLIVGKKEIEI